MRPKLLRSLGLLRSALPYLWGFAAASAADYVVDVQNLFLPALAGAAALSVSIIVTRRAARSQRMSPPAVSATAASAADFESDFRAGAKSF
jgi:hypothetical protein